MNEMYIIVSLYVYMFGKEISQRIHFWIIFLLITQIGVFFFLQICWEQSHFVGALWSIIKQIYQFLTKTQSSPYISVYKDDFGQIPEFFSSFFFPKNNCWSQDIWYPIWIIWCPIWIIWPLSFPTMYTMMYFALN